MNGIRAAGDKVLHGPRFSVMSLALWFAFRKEEPTEVQCECCEQSATHVQTQDDQAFAYCANCLEGPR